LLSTLFSLIIGLDNGGHYTYPTWSPDGNKLAFVSFGHDDQHSSLTLGITLYDLRSGSEVVVYETQSNLGGYITDIAWSPDQEKLAFVMENDDAQGIGEIYLLDITNGGLNQLTDGWLVSTPNFSPDGNKIIFVGNREPYELGTKYDLFVIDFDGNCHRIEAPVLRLDGVVISQGGEKVVFDTYHGVLTAKPEIALGDDFWHIGERCEAPLQ
jgi:Tol biopolymer transport system component